MFKLGEVYKYSSLSSILLRIVNFFISTHMYSKILVHLERYPYL